MTASGPERLILTTVEDGVGVLRLNRADKRNAMSADLAHQLHEAIAALDADASVVAIVVTGSGGSFSAGADMNESLAAYERGDRGFNPSARSAARVAASPKPTIAAIEGPAVMSNVPMVFPAGVFAKMSL